MKNRRPTIGFSSNKLLAKEVQRARFALAAAVAVVTVVEAKASEDPPSIKIIIKRTRDF